jgi:hypothetical protein
MLPEAARGSILLLLKTNIIRFNRMILERFIVIGRFGRYIGRFNNGTQSFKPLIHLEPIMASTILEYRLAEAKMEGENRESMLYIRQRKFFL